MCVEYSSFTNLLAASGSFDTIGAILAIRIVGSSALQSYVSLVYNNVTIH